MFFPPSESFPLRQGARSPFQSPYFPCFASTPPPPSPPNLSSQVGFPRRDFPQQLLPILSFPRLSLFPPPPPAALSSKVLLVDGANAFVHVSVFFPVLLLPVHCFSFLTDVVGWDPLSTPTTRDFLPRIFFFLPPTQTPDSSLREHRCFSSLQPLLFPDFKRLSFLPNLFFFSPKSLQTNPRLIYPYKLF